MRALFPETIVTLLSLSSSLLRPSFVALPRRADSMPSLAATPFFSRYRLLDVLACRASGFLDGATISLGDYFDAVLMEMHFLFIFSPLQRAVTPPTGVIPRNVESRRGRDTQFTVRLCIYFSLAQCSSSSTLFSHVRDPHFMRRSVN